jgi:uncharacterized protein (TIGR00730 family)
MSALPLPELDRRAAGPFGPPPPPAIEPAVEPPGSLVIGVFCGASPGDSPVYSRAGYELGRQLGMRGHRLLYGAGGIGVMEAVARGAAEEGASIVGIVPIFLQQREARDSVPTQEIFLTRSRAHRKSLMLSHADAFVALPGGYGTLDETLEVISASALNSDRKPVVLVNTGGFWDPFVTLIDALAGRGFVPSGRSFTIVQDPGEAIRCVETAVASANCRKGSSRR